MEKSKRKRQVADIIRQQIAIMLKKDIRDPRLNGITITSVDISPDLKNAKVFFALSDMAQLDEVNKAFLKAAGYLRRSLAEQLDLRHMPNIRFTFDKSIEYGTKMSELIEKAKQEDQRVKEMREKEDE